MTEIDKLRSSLFFTGKIALLTCFFSILRLYLFYDDTKNPTGDHIHDDHIATGEPSQFTLFPNLNTQRLDNRIEEKARALLTSEHGAATTATPKFMDEICTAYEDICQKTTRQGSFTRDEQANYQLLTIYLIKMIDERLEDGSVRDALANLLFFKDPDSRRGSAGYTNVRINTERIPTRPEFREVLTHEFGHTIDFSILLGTKRTKHPTFTEFNEKRRPIDDPSIPYYELSRSSESVRKKDSSFKDFISGYAMKWIYEDFAEHQNAWFNHNAVFEYLASSNPILEEKYSFFAELYDGEYFNANERLLQTLDLQKRPRDSTRMKE